MNVIMGLIDPVPGRITDHIMPFHLFQPIPFTPIAPDQDLARVLQVTPKQIGTDVQEAVPISLPTFPASR